MSSSTFRPFKEGSRANWGVSLCSDKTLSTEQVQLGATLRIADSMELMAKNHLSLQSDMDFYKDKSERLSKETARLARSNAALRGQVTKLKNKYAHRP